MEPCVWFYDNKPLQKYSLTEILTLPSLNIHITMINISHQFNNCIFIDTIGNLKIYSDICNLFYNVLSVYSLRQFMRELKKLKSKYDFVLFIDSITFLVDKGLNNFKDVYSMLWSLIYNNKCTIIVSNHYRVEKINNDVFLVPRLGDLWSNIVSYRILYKYIKNKIIYTIEIN